MKPISVWFVILGISWISLSCETLTSQEVESSALANTQLPRSEILKALAVKVMQPAYLQLHERMEKLQAQTAEYCTTPNVQTLHSLRKAWLQADATWQHTSAFRFGPAMNLEQEMKFWPVRARMIQSEMKRLQQGQSKSMTFVGVPAKGLGTVEFLLHPPEGNGTEANQLAAETCPWLKEVVNELVLLSGTIQEAWNTPESRMSQEFADLGTSGAMWPTAHKALSELVNRMIQTVQHIEYRKVGKPLMGNGREPWPKNLEAHRSGESLELIKAELQSFEALWRGHWTQQSPAVHSMHAMIQQTNAALAQRVTRQLRQVQLKIQAVPSPLTTALTQHKEHVTELHQSLKVLLVMLKVDMAGHLGVIVDFGDNDSD